MSIKTVQNTFFLHTNNSSLQLKVDEYGLLRHVWYGEKTGQDMSYLQDYPDVGFSGQLWEARKDRTYSPDTILQEYSCFGNGDYRIPAAAAGKDGAVGLDLRYVSHRILSGREPLENLPYVKAEKEDVQTLEVVLMDDALQLEATLRYIVFEEEDVIARHTVFTNHSSHVIQLEKAASLQMDFHAANLDLIHFYGRHLKERTPERISLPHGITEISSLRGTSSHQHNPAVIIADKNTTEDNGHCVGMMLLYSGCFSIEAEKDQLDQTRVVMGIHPDMFGWQLPAGGSFTTPEAAVSFCAEGLQTLSSNFHRLIREHIIDQNFRGLRPVLLNSWEAAYFNFDGDKILNIARQAADLGVDMIVLDDGWFGKRNSDSSSLGDWSVNEKKLGRPLSVLIEEIKKLGLQFGIWVEPEMVSQDSDLYKAHPDWALQIPGRNPIVGRNQLVLDMSRQEVIDYLYDSLYLLFSLNDISYVKWDMNRSITDWYSHALLASRQKELPHRYVLGVYQLLDRLKQAFPNILFEGCSGGGGRYDAGMLFYTPQIWGSDDTDPYERTMIHYGTSFFYPACTLASHVSASPNHQTGRHTSLEARGTVSMHGIFGYELDPGLLSLEEKETIRQQIKWYRHLQPLITEGTCFRLSNPQQEDKALWMFVSPDQNDVLVQGLIYQTIPTRTRRRIRLKGLNPDKIYRLSATNFTLVENEEYTGKALMSGGILLPLTWGSNAPVTMILHAADEEEMEIKALKSTDAIKSETLKMNTQTAASPETETVLAAKTQTSMTIEKEKISIVPQQIINADILYPHIKKRLDSPRTIISIAGGSGSGKSGMSILLKERLEQDGLHTLVIHGDNYPHRIPKENDMMRMSVFDKGGEQALDDYLGSDKELDFSQINSVLHDFKNGRKDTTLRVMGRKPGEIAYFRQNLEDVQVLILEWTHGLSENLEHADIRILLDCTPEQTLAARLERNRDAGADSPFVSMVLRLEQAKIDNRKNAADLIQSRDGRLCL